MYFYAPRFFLNNILFYLFFYCVCIYCACRPIRGARSPHFYWPQAHKCARPPLALRRLIKEKISLLRQQLASIDKQKTLQRKNRESLVRVALVGYTNVGKSTLMNLLSKSDVFAENKLFATLDTTVRKVVIGNLPFLLTDTVGFIRKLPTQLVESFKSTLDEVVEADLLLHVVDLSHPDHEEQIAAVNRTLADIGAADKPTILVYNKIDAVPKEDDEEEPVVYENTANKLFISAAEKQNIDVLRDTLYNEVSRIHAIRYPYNNFLY